MQGLNAVTTLQTFGLEDDRPLFTVNAGIPVERALEKAAQLMSCVDAMTRLRARSNPELDAKVIRYLARAAGAIVQACRAEPVNLH